MSDSFKRLDALPDWARGVLQQAPASEPKSLLGRDAAVWPLLVDAATTATFLPRELQPSALSGAERRRAEQSVLELSELAGARWSLTRDWRRHVLSQCEPGELRSAIERSPASADDPLTEALRAYLRGTTQESLDALSIEQLEARRLAASWLRGISGLALPSMEELDRQIELRRLLSPFERMIGRKPGKPDRFFGRASEVERLRAYVQVIAADNLAQKVARGISNFTRLFRGRKPLTVWGTGGVGKTTLVAYFMLEHAHAARGRFPFAYLDFDRSTISARNRASLLAEIVRQVGAQFPALTATMDALRHDLAEVASMIELRPESDSVALLQPFAMRFRAAFDDAFESEPFLLVFDTFEVVQYAPDQVRALEELVRAFTTTDDSWGASSGDTPVWGRLRLIISGRRRVPEFLGATEELPLGPLDPAGSAQLLEALAADAGKSIDSRDARRLVEAVRRDSGDRSGAGVRPLRLRLVGELFREEEADGPSIVQSLLHELENPDAEQKKLGKLLIDGILVRRILGHVANDDVRALADPGLVVRRITRDVIRDVMTRGTDRGGEGDPPTIEKPWIVDDAEAKRIFEAFQREVSLVEQDGAALRHRQDVRAEMLPLIRKRRPNGFRRIHQLAYDHFRERAGRDAAAAEEAIYHGLWLGVPIEELDATFGGAARLRIDPEEFEGGSPANLYLRARNDEPLAAEDAGRLPVRVAVEWLGRRAHEWLGAKRLDECTLTIRAVSRRDYSALDERQDVAAPAARLLFRAGQWDDAARLLRRHVEREIPRSEAEQSLLRTWATIVAKSGVEAERLDWIVLAASEIHDSLVRTEVLAYAALAERSEPATLTSISRQMMNAALMVNRSVWRRNLRTLRLAIAARPQYGMEELLKTFADVCETLPRDRSVAELLSRFAGTEASLPEIDSIWRSVRGSMLGEALEDPDRRDALRRIAVTDHGDWFLPFGNALDRHMGGRGVRKGIISRIPEAWHPRIRQMFEHTDGLTLVQMLTTEGVLLAFAHLLAEEPAESGAYPDTAPRLAAALVRWHELTSA